MSVGFVMLCHTALDRAAQVARHWAERGCPVVIHVDRRVKRRAYDGLMRALGDLANVRFSGRHACEWGTWGIVAATQEAATIMLRDFPQARHVYLASGSCLPLRPVEELVSYLAARPRTDFIESVTTEDVGWTIGGLDLERFTLRFPFSWRKQRRLFDGYVKLQRRVRYRRRIPAGIVPHLGSQWWCLTRKTLSTILEDPERAAIDRYFRRVWIPDESYFQTMVRQVSSEVESRSLTLSKFDFQGKPHIFYDDHLQLLRRSDCFVARKIWPHAERLYKTFLSDDAGGQTSAEPNPGKIDRLFAKAVERRTKGRPGLYMQSRHPNEHWENGRTAAPYSVFEGFNEVFEGFEERGPGEAGEIEAKEVEMPRGAAQGLAGREAGTKDEGARRILAKAAGGVGDFLRGEDGVEETGVKTLTGAEGAFPAGAAGGLAERMAEGEAEGAAESGVGVGEIEIALSTKGDAKRQYGESDHADD